MKTFTLLTTRHIYIVFLLSFLLSVTDLSAQEFGNSIVIPAGQEKVLIESVDDMKDMLQKATRSTFQVSQGNATGRKAITLRLLSDNYGSLTNQARKQLRADGQSFHLLVDKDDAAIITGTGTNSLINGIYTFLQELGFKWYMPGDNWTMIPRSIRKLNINKVYTPDFRNRFYFGSGGISAIQGIDPTDNFSKDYITWNRRNRISSDYPNKGHSGLAFYSAMKTELDKHPEYFCGGKVNKNGWIDISQKSAVDIFVKWAHTQVKPGTRFPLIGVDPADGSGGKGDCLPANMKGISTWSDKYFWLANKVAETIPANDEQTLVQLYAYNQHAAPPQFALNKKVFPVIIPYAFQDVTDPEEFIKIWYQKTEGRGMGIYDYWNITQWGKCLPDFNVYSIPQKLKLWKKNNVTTINLESTYSKGAMGHAFWIATQMMWDADLSFEKLFNQFLEECYGAAAPDIRKMYDRWSLSNQGAMEVSLSLHDLNSAAAKVKDPQILDRISEMKAYVKYLELYYNYTATPTVANYETLLNYMYGIHHLRMVHTWALSKYYIPKPKGYNTPADKKAEAAINSKVRILSRKDIEKSFETAVNKATPRYDVYAKKMDVRKAKPATDNTPAKNPTYINNRNTYNFYINGRQNLVLEAGSTKDTRLVIEDSTGKKWYDKIISATRTDYQKVEVVLPAGYYNLSFGETARYSRLKLPTSIVFFSGDNNYDNAGYPVHYIYVPKSVTSVIYNDQLGPGINDRGYWRTPDGQKLWPVKVAAGVYKLDIPAGHRGKIWGLDIGHRKFKMLNIPSVYSLNKFEYAE